MASRTVPLPLPLPEAEIHEALLVAVQAHPLWACTDTFAAPPDESTVTVEGETENVHAAACCEIPKF